MMSLSDDKQADIINAFNTKDKPKALKRDSIYNIDMLF